MKTFTSKIIIKQVNSILLSTTGFLVVFFIWVLVSGRLNPLILPSPGETWSALKDIFFSGKLIKNLLITVQRTLVGYSLALIAGILLALFLNTNRVASKIFRPLISVIQTTPPVIWLALAVIWFGIAENFTPIFLIFIVTLPVIFINIFEGLKNMDQELVEMAHVYKTSKQQIYLHIYLPALMPHIVSAMTIGLAFAWKSTVFAEYIGSSSGIGFALSMANSNLETDKLFAWALVLVGLMLIIEYLILRPVQRKITGWRKHA